MCAKLRTMAASNNRDHSIIACLHHLYMGVVLRSHSVHGEPRIQRNANGEVATIYFHIEGFVVVTMSMVLHYPEKDNINEQKRLVPKKQ